MLTMDDRIRGAMTDLAETWDSIPEKIRDVPVRVLPALVALMGMSMIQDFTFGQLESEVSDKVEVDGDIGDDDDDEEDEAEDEAAGHREDVEDNEEDPDMRAPHGEWEEIVPPTGDQPAADAAAPGHSPTPSSGQKRTRSTGGEDDFVEEDDKVPDEDEEEEAKEDDEDEDDGIDTSGSEEEEEGENETREARAFRRRRFVDDQADVPPNEEDDDTSGPEDDDGDDMDDGDDDDVVGMPKADTTTVTAEVPATHPPTSTGKPASPKKPRLDTDAQVDKAE